jgi:putative transposase
MRVGTGGEGAKTWLTELRNRGVQDVLVACCDGLKGLPDSINAVWPLADIQLCVVHTVRSSLRFASKKHWGPIAKDLRAVYPAPTADAAEARFEEFEATWGTLCPAMIESLNARFRRPPAGAGTSPTTTQRSRSCTS